MFMIKRWWLVWFLLVGLIPSGAYSQPARKVAVLPFQINSLEDLSYLSTEIPRLIKTELRQEGVLIVEPDPADLINWTGTQADSRKARRIGIKEGLDLVVWGSLTRIGDQFSLDIKAIEPLLTEDISAFFLSIEGIENLLVGLQELSRDIGFKLFDRAAISEIVVTGNRRIEVDAIQRYIKSKPGDIYLPSRLSNDLKSIYSMGYFEDIRIEAKDISTGKRITFQVKEKPTIRYVKFKGNRVYDDEEIEEALNIKSGSILNIFAIQNNIIRIEDLYKEKNYHNAAVQYEIEELDNNQGDLLFIIEEGEKIKIERIRFDGNLVYSEKELKKIIKTNERGPWSWLSGSGELDKEQLSQDTIMLRNFYHNSGFIQAKVAKPEVEYLSDMIYISFKIEEGPKYKVGQVSVTGDLFTTEEELLDQLKITQKEFYSRETVRNDLVTLTDLYSDQGYAYADVYPRIQKKDDILEVNIEYVVKQGKKVYFESIIISGNNKSRDKVIRRELKVYEKELYSGKALKRSIRNLYRLDFFEDVQWDTVAGEKDDEIILKIDVAEKPTGNFMFGGGYSSIDYGYITAAVSQNNLFGRGQKLQLKATLSGRTRNYTLSFTEPYLLDTNISAGFDIYDQEREYNDYDKDSQGGRVRLGYKLIDYTRLFWSYNYDISNLSDIDEDASDDIKTIEEDFDGELITSSTKATLRYDSRDRLFNPTEGKLGSISLEYAGLGGDVGFTKYEASSGWFFPLFWGTVGMLHAKGGYVHENGAGEILPDYERYYLGGMNSVRGFDWRDISTFDENGDEIGGNRFVQFNIEWSFPLFNAPGLMGVFFLDAGNVFGEDDELNMQDPLRKGGGVGIRWYSPLGPLRLEYGWILDPQEDEDTDGRLEFSVGALF